MSEGIKFDGDKPRPDLVLGDFMPALEHAVFIGTFGAAKYAARNFQTLEGGEERYAEAHMRHYIARKKGELFDSESGELHLGHEIWDKIAELYFWLKENGHRTWEKAVRSKSTGLYYGPLENELGSCWQDEPYWWDAENARKIVWRLAAEQKGELDIRVEVREQEFDPVLDEIVFAGASKPDQTAFVVHYTGGSRTKYLCLNRGWVDDINDATLFDGRESATLCALRCSTTATEVEEVVRPEQRRWLLRKGAHYLGDAYGEAYVEDRDVAHRFTRLEAQSAAELFDAKMEAV